MSQYGTFVEDYEPVTEALYAGFVEFLGNPKMYKIKDVESYSMYMVKTECMLSNECRFLIALVRQDAMPMHHAETLDNLQWVSFQARTLTDRHDIPAHGYTARYGPLKAVVTKTGETDETTTYGCEDFPITIVMLNRKNQAYQDRGTVGHAIETFQTIITINDTV